MFNANRVEQCTLSCRVYIPKTMLAMSIKCFENNEDESGWSLENYSKNANTKFKSDYSPYGYKTSISRKPQAFPCQTKTETKQNRNFFFFFVFYYYDKL